MKELVVLSEEDIIYCYEECIGVKLYTRLPTRLKEADELALLKHYKKNGGYDPSERRVAVYLPNIRTLREYKVTLFHEFAHVIDDLLFDERYTEKQIEKIAQATYQTNRSLFEFIKEMYQLKDTKFEEVRGKK